MRFFWQRGTMTLEMILFISGAVICAALALPVLFEHLKAELSVYTEADAINVK